MWWLVVFFVVFFVGITVGWMARGRAVVADSVVADSVVAADVETRSTVERERRLLRIVEALPLGVFVFDESGNELFANGVAARLSNDRLHQALIVATVAEVVAGASEDRAVQKMLELYGSPRTHLSIRGVPVGAAVVGQAAVVVTIEDTTELHRADLLRRDFVANVSHELKTPIGAIGLLAETLLDVDDPDVAKRLAGRLQNESYRLAATIDDLLTLARIESGGQMQLGDVLVADLLSAVAGRVGVQIEEKAISLDFAIEPDDLAVWGDRVQLMSGLGNLLDNAVKYSENGSTVSVRATEAGDGVTIEVADRGVGIPETDLDRIFERFYRVDRGRSRDTGGTGLGLSIVRHVVLNHGGSIDVESEEGVGTTFVAVFPASRRHEDGGVVDGPIVGRVADGAASAEGTGR